MQTTSAYCKVTALMTLLALYSGCATTQEAIKHRHLETDVKMSDSIFLEPTHIEQKSIWLDIRNTTDHEIDLSALRGMLMAKGYRIVSDPTEPGLRYRLQINTLYTGAASIAAIDQARYAGYGGPLAGVLTGATAGALIGGSSRAALIGGGIGGLLAAGGELVAGSLVKTVTYSVVCDIRLSERAAGVVVQRTSSQLRQGSQSTIAQESNGTSAWQHFTTRLSAVATKTNLKFEDAKPELEAGIVKSVAGIL